MRTLRDTDYFPSPDQLERCSLGFPSERAQESTRASVGTAAKMALPPRTRARPNGQPDPASTIERKPPRHVKFACTMEKSAPHRVLAARGWREVDDDSWDWDVMWADTGWVHDNVTYNVTTQPQRLRENQRVNHFPNHVELTRKDLLAKNVKRAKRQAEKDGADPAEFDFIPKTYVLPGEGQMLLREVREKGGTWIMKPIGRAQGTGIFLVNKVKQIEDWLKRRGTEAAENKLSDDYVCQRYVDDPYLVDDRKFDMRIYVLVLSYQPLKVYLYREGFARFTNTPYSTAKSDLKNPYVHLTNHAIQKRDVDYDPSVDDLKMPIQDLYTHMRSTHGQDAADRCFAGMHGVIINALRSVSQVMINDKHCYELYGYDIMIDAELRPWLIEVNASPSMSSDSQSDADLKAALLDDTFTCLDAEEVFEGRTPPRVGGFDLVCEDGKLTRTAEWGGLPTLLGADNSDRLEALERLRRWCKKGKAGEERAKARSAALVAATGMPPIVHW